MVQAQHYGLPPRGDFHPAELLSALLLAKLPAPACAKSPLCIQQAQELQSMPCGSIPPAPGHCSALSLSGPQGTRQTPGPSGWGLCLPKGDGCVPQSLPPTHSLRTTISQPRFLEKRSLEYDQALLGLPQIWVFQSFPAAFPTPSGMKLVGRVHGSIRKRNAVNRTLHISQLIALNHKTVLPSSADTHLCHTDVHTVCCTEASACKVLK